MINGSLKGMEKGFDHELEEVVKRSKEKTENVEYYNLKELTINQCVGCFGCWVKTPGLCVFDDDMEQILKSIVHSDLLVFASPLVMGFVSSLIKRCMDRMIPLIHPYFDFVRGEMHHMKRYESYPQLGIIYQKSEDDTEEDVSICRAIFERFVINMHSELRFFVQLRDSEEELI